MISFIYGIKSIQHGAVSPTLFYFAQTFTILATSTIKKTELIEFSGDENWL
jgi:hypothetical protein